MTGNGVPCSYSIPNHPCERNRYMLAVLREPNGRGSAWMQDRVKLDDRLTVRGSRNAFAVWATIIGGAISQ